MAAQNIQQQQSPMALPISYSDGVTEFTCDLYKNVCAGKPENAVISPYSVSAAMMLTMLGTGGASKNQILEALRLGDVPTANIHEEYKKLHTKLNENVEQAGTLSIANRIFSKADLLLKATYTANSKQYYESEMELLDFGRDPEGSRKIINDWVEEQTNKKIQDLIPSGAINDRTYIVLANAIYFKGSWEKKFPTAGTAKRQFSVTPTEKVNIDMMHAEEQKLRMGWSQMYDCQSIELPYINKSRSMVVLLPNAVDGLAKLEEKISLNMLNQVMKEMQEVKVEVVLPKFKIEAKYDLQAVLKNLGVHDVFSSEKADLSEMFEKSTADAYVSDVVHKAYIEVNEEGTEAAAATGVMIRMMSMPIQFVADHPFMFMIRDNKTGTVLFIGKYIRPATE